MIRPLSLMQATELILVPETTLSLITKDTQASMAEALQTMRDSSRYGSLLFPLEEGEELCDHLVQERADVRIRQVATEDKVEIRVLKEQGLWRAEDEELRAGIIEGANTHVVTRLPRPVPLGRVKCLIE